MSELDLTGIGKKIIGMTKRLNRLSTYQSLTFEEYLQNEDRQATIERYLEIVIQAAIDINRMLIKHREDTDLEKLTNAEAFTLAGELGFITSELAAQLALSAGFRNVLAHVYSLYLIYSVHSSALNLDSPGVRLYLIIEGKAVR